MRVKYVPNIDVLSSSIVRTDGCSGGDDHVREIVQAAFGRLTERQQREIVDRVLDGLPYRAIGQSQGITKEGARKSCIGALQALERELPRYDELFPKSTRRREG